MTFKKLGSVPSLTDQHKNLFENMTLDQLRAEKKAALFLLIQWSKGSYLYEQTMMELGFINRCISDLEKIS